MSDSCPCCYCFGDDFLVLLPITMFLTGLVLLITDTLREQHGCEQAAAGLIAVIFVVIGPISAFSLLLDSPNELLLVTFFCGAPLLIVPGLLLLIIGVQRVSERRLWGSTTAKVIESAVKQESRQVMLSVTYQYTVKNQTYTDYLLEMRPEEKRWVVDWMADHYPVGKEVPLTYLLMTPQENVFASITERSGFPGSWLIALSLVLFYWAYIGLCVWDGISKSGFD